MRLQRPPASYFVCIAPILSLLVFVFWFRFFSGLDEVPADWFRYLLAWACVGVALASFWVGTRAHTYRAGVAYWKARGAS